jgi:hypothetical protein
VVPQVDLESTLERVGLGDGVHLHAGLAGRFEEPQDVGGE